MLLIVKPGALCLNVRAYRKLELIGPDIQGFFSLALVGNDMEVLAISRNRPLAEGVVTSLFRCIGAQNRGRDVEWPTELLALYLPLDGDDYESPRIEVRDLEPTVRLASSQESAANGICLDTGAAEALIAAMTSGEAVPGLWDPPLFLRFGRSGGRRFQAQKEVTTFIARLQAAVAHVRECDAAGRSTADTKPKVSPG